MTTRIIDHTIRIGLVVLIVLPPIAFGGVHPCTYMTIEIIIFSMVTLCMIGTPVERPPINQDFAVRWRGDVGGLWRARNPVFVPLSLFTLLILLELLPLPPRLLRMLSPRTYMLYAVALPGWPAWRTISICPSLTRGAFLKFAAYVSLFTLILNYPERATLKRTWGPWKSSRAGATLPIDLCARVLIVAILSGLVVAVISIVQRFTWNGKILWFFVPYDWGTAQPGLLPRASGPFINPDHLGNYLAMVFPIAAAGALFPAAFGPRSLKAFQLFCATVLFVVLIGVLLSLSRGGWCGALAGTGVLALLTPSPFRLERRRGWLVLLGAALLALLLALTFVNSNDRTQLDVRLRETVMRDATFAATTSLGERFRTWSDSLRMVGEFPVFGVGLGSWPEIFERYRRPPWTGAGFWREAHNDYVQALCETGFIGFTLLAWLAYRIARTLYRGCVRIEQRGLPLLGALIAALSATLVHEFFDFSLQIPSNALLFVILLALAVRVSLASEPAAREAMGRNWRLGWNGMATGRRILCVLPPSAALILIFLSLHQDLIPYPQSLKFTATVVEAEREIAAHPALPTAHLALIQLTPRNPIAQGSSSSPRGEQSSEALRSVRVPSQSGSDSVLRQIEAVIYLQPTNPYARDLLAEMLFREQRNPEGLMELRRSAFLSPTLTTHHYYNVGAIPGLATDQRTAIEDGLKDAVAVNYDGAVDALADFYKGLALFGAAADLYREAALREKDMRIKTQYLVSAGRSYERAGDLVSAERLFREAAAESRTDPRPYQFLVNDVFAPKRDLASIKAIVAAGICGGADPFTMDLILADAAQKSGDMKLAEATLLKAIAIEPASYDANRNLGSLYLNQRDFDRAADAFRTAVELNPGSAEAFYLLGSAEENRYEFAAAEKAFAIAARLAPRDTIIQSRYQRLRGMLLENAPNHS